MNRRKFLTGLTAAIAAPAIARASSLMPIRGIVMPASPGYMVLHMAPGGPYRFSIIEAGEVIEFGTGVFRCAESITRSGLITLSRSSL